MTLSDAFEYDPLAPDVLADPYPYYAQLRRDAPVYHVPTRDLWVVSRYADVLDLLRRPELFSSAAMGAAVVRPSEFTPEREDSPEDPEESVSIVGADGERHARLRSVLNRGFTPARMEALAPRVRSIARQLADPLLENGECEFLADFAAPFPVTVIAELLGVDAARRADFKRWADAAVLGVFEVLDEEQQLRVGESLTEMADYFDLVIEQRCCDPGNDLISTLVRAEQNEGTLTATEVKTFVFTLLVAGSVTTTHLIANAMRALIAHPEVWEAVASDRSLLPGLVEEALRFDSPVQMLFRTACKNVEVAGVEIPAGATVGPLFGSANRDEAVFAEPQRFDPTRNPRDHLAFGHGIHFCLGAALARLEVRSAFEVLLEHIHKLSLADGPVRMLESLVFRGPERLRLRFELR